MSFPNSVSHRYGPFRPKGHRGKEKLAVGHTGANEIFRDMKVKSTFGKSIPVKDSHCDCFFYMTLKVGSMHSMPLLYVLDEGTMLLYMG